jgi:thioredoxin reductase (NADPH)
MGKPAILTLDDDTNVLRAVERDLRREYGRDFRIARADSGSAALELLEALKKRGDPSALFLVDQRMPGMSGVEFLEKAIQIDPEAKRVLLTAYADTDAAIRAINEVQIDHYGAHRPPFEGIRVVGNPWDPVSHQVKDFLSRNQIPYLWLDPEVSQEAQDLLDSADVPILPCLFFADGSNLVRPGDRQIADKVGLQTTASGPFYDLVVAGGGPAGLAAAVYGASEGLRTLVVEEKAPGGQAGMSSRIENYLGFPGGLSGAELARRAVSQAKRFGVEILNAQRVVGLDTTGPSRTVILGDGSTVRSRALLIATGVSYRQLDAKGILDLTGAGVYYGAAMTEGEQVRGGHVFVVGGANSAGQAAMYFSGYAEQVTMLVRGESLSSSMSQYLIDQIDSTGNIDVRTGTQLQEAIGGERLEELVLATGGGSDTERVAASALFIFIGARPRTDWMGDAVARDERGFVLSGLDAAGADGAEAAYALYQRAPFMLETSVPGVFVAGDVRHGSVKRVASAVGEGSMAVMYVHHYLSSA